MTLPPVATDDQKSPAEQEYLRLIEAAVQKNKDALDLLEMADELASLEQLFT